VAHPPASSPDEIARRIAPQTGRLQALGVKSLGLFGSAARGEARATSDLDILVEFTGPATFDRYMDLKFLLEGLLGRRVDLVTRRALKPQIRERVERDLIHVA
jgi:predicted nucleotidyltransferase